MQLKVAELSDVDALVHLGYLFTQEAPNYKNHKFNADLARQHFEQVIQGNGVAFILENGLDVVGGFVGRIASDWFCDTRIAFDDALFVMPKYRKTRAAYLLVRAFIEWAKEMRVDRIQCGTTTGIEESACIRLYKHFGLTHFGTVLDMVVSYE
jgi:GNAT superfamily N-acetyltransferase